MTLPRIFRRRSRRQQGAEIDQLKAFMLPLPGEERVQAERIVN